MTTTLSAQSRVAMGQLDRAKLDQIPCPNLRTLVNEGWLTPDADGLVDLQQLDQALKRIGVEGLPKKFLVGGAQKATAEAVSKQLGDMATGKFNILKLTGSNLDHPGDTRILRGGFNAERLDWVLSFANADGRIGMKELSRAQQEARSDEPTTFRDRALGVAELTALAKVYGTVDKNGDKTISVDGVRDLYQNARFPDEWRAKLQESETLGSVSPQKTGLLRLIGGVIDMSFRQLGTATGRAIDGMMMAVGRDRQIDQSSAIGLGHGMCPAGPPASMSKAETQTTHAQ